jgi:hypothetical protein
MTVLFCQVALHITAVKNGLVLQVDLRFTPDLMVYSLFYTGRR